MLLPVAAAMFVLGCCGDRARLLAAVGPPGFDWLLGSALLDYVAFNQSSSVTLNINLFWASFVNISVTEERKMQKLNILKAKM